MLAELIRDSLLAKQRHSKSLHPSSDITGRLRHAQLRIAGAPTLENPIDNAIRAMTGTLWHNYIEDEALPKSQIWYRAEQRVDEGLPERWGGRVDWLIYDLEHQAFLLGDLKTTSALSMQYTLKDGPKYEHKNQLSAYWHALSALGYPLISIYTIVYLSLDKPNSYVKGWNPIVEYQETPIPKESLWTPMEYRSKRVSEYLESLPSEDIEHTDRTWEEYYITPYLDTHVDWSQKVYKNKEKYDLKIVPQWDTKYCPYPIELCDCKDLSYTKIGEYNLKDDLWIYTPRKGYEDVEPEKEFLKS
jgi:hypothetical protein